MLKPKKGNLTRVDWSVVFLKQIPTNHAIDFRLLLVELPFCAQSCEDLEVYGVWLDPFDNQNQSAMCQLFVK